MTKLTVPSQTPSGVVRASKYSRSIAMQATELIGGLERLAEEGDKDPKWFFEKIFTKLMAPEKEQTREQTVAEIIAELDSRMVDVTPTKVPENE